MNLIFWYAGEIPIQHDEVGPTPFFLHADIRKAHDIDAFAYDKNYMEAETR